MCIFFRVCTAKVFDKSDPEGDDAAKRELKNLKSLRHERMVSSAQGRPRVTHAANSDRSPLALALPK